MSLENVSQYRNISLFGIDLGNLPNAIQIGNFPILFYGIIIACGLLLAVLYGCKRCKQFGISVDDLTDGVLCIVPVAIICARLYYCIFEWDSYKDDLLSILDIRSGGLAIYGGVIGAMVGIVVLCKVKKIKVGALMDLAALGLLIGQAIGRWGNFFNREAFGSEVAETSFWAMGLMTSSGTWVYQHPTFLYESLWNAVGFVALHFLSKKRQYDGQIVLGYVAWYGLGRTFIEGLRTDSLYWGSFRVSQMLAAISCFVAVGILLYMAFQKHDPAQLFVNKVAAEKAVPEKEAASGMEPLILEDILDQTEEISEEETEPAEQIPGEQTEDI